MNKILIVEDEIAISDLIKIELTSKGYICEVANEGNFACNLIEEKNYDLILLDIMIPNVDGFELLSYIKQISNTPTIFLTAKNLTKDKVKGLKNGADDYITKPFSIDELCARIEAVLRRYNKANEVIQIEGVEINIVSRMVKKDSKIINLTPKEFDLLVLLIQNKNFALYREVIFEFETRTLDLHIQRLRKKLGWKNKIKTVYKIGYMLEIK